jgi:hypothetical protein
MRWNRRRYSLTAGDGKTPATTIACLKRGDSCSVGGTATTVESNHPFVGHSCRSWPAKVGLRNRVRRVGPQVEVPVSRRGNPFGWGA